MPVVSVIMGVYNCEATVARSIDSILAQSFADWELILCDDGSQDATYDRISAYSRKYPNKIIVLRSHRNEGLAKALNRCLAHCGGKYIARMDGDDIAFPARLEKQVAFLEKNTQYALVGSRAVKFDEKGTWARFAVPLRPGKAAFLRGNPFIHPSVLFRRQVVEKIGGYCEEKRAVRCEDYDLWMRFYANGYKGYNLPICLLNYYEGRDSYEKRTYRHRIHEAQTRLHGFKQLGLFPSGWPYVIKPLLVGLLPRATLCAYKHWKATLKNKDRHGKF